MSDETKLSLSGRGTLGAGRGRETGKVRQNFSHGRSKPVVVERRKKRILKKGPGEAAEAAPAPTTAPTPAPAPAAPSFKPKKPAAAEAGTLTSQELEARKKALESLEGERRRIEEDRERLEDEARRRAEEERRRKAEEDAVREAAEAVRKAEEAERGVVEEAETGKADEEAKRLAEVAAKRAAEEKVRRKAEAEARKKAEEEERVREEAKKKAEAKKPVRKRAADEEEERAGKPRRARGGDSRRAGKLTVNRAFGDDEEGRARSLAAFRRAQAKRKGRAPVDQAKQVREVVIPEIISVQELGNRMAEKGTDVIKTLMKLGVMATINESLDQDTAELVVTEMGHTPKRVSESDVELALPTEEDKPEDLKPRPPVVTIMGHVDHGKTSLLDALRETDVVAGEAGGITQHIGAYQVQLPSGQAITFLDTPGHEAFTQMRARGASVTDLVVLVVAADDGIMPQTVEAINHAKAAGVPMIVAINKIDLPGANPDRVRQELLQHDVQVEAMGGDVLDVEVSALKKLNLAKLEEAILLQSELLEISANPDRAAEGVVVEAKLEKGRGPVATVLIRRGTLRVGDIFVAGPEWGKVRALVDERNRQLTEAGPAQPVEVIGLNGAPSAGDDFAVVESETRAREIAAYRSEQVKRKRLHAAPSTIESMFTQLKEKKAEEFPIVLKGDVQGSVEAISQALGKIGAGEIDARILHAAVGGVTEADVTLANASGAIIIGFNVRANNQAREAAERDGVPIKYYSVIYDLVDEVKAAMAGQLGPAIEETVIGRAEVRDVFSAGKTGKAAGCFVNEGTVKRGAKARLLRDDVVIYNGRILSVRRFKDDVEEVKSGTECGVTFENYADMKVGDQVEVYETKEVERRL